MFSLVLKYLLLAFKEIGVEEEKNLCVEYEIRQKADLFFYYFFFFVSKRKREAINYEKICMKAKKNSALEGLTGFCNRHLYLK